MSAGKQVISKYKHIDGTSISKIRVNQKTLALEINGAKNDAATGAVNTKLFMKVSKGKIEIGRSPMKIRIKIKGDPPTGYSTDSIATLPLLNAAIKAQAYAATSETSIKYLDVNWEFVGIQEENIV